MSGLTFKPCGHATTFVCNCAAVIEETADAIARERGLDADSRLEAALQRVAELRAARAADIERRDRAAWDYILHTASLCSFFKRQAE